MSCLCEAHVGLERVCVCVSLSISHRLARALPQQLPRCRSHRAGALRVPSPVRHTYTHSHAHKPTRTQAHPHHPTHHPPSVELRSRWCCLFLFFLVGILPRAAATPQVAPPLHLLPPTRSPPQWCALCRLALVIFLSACPRSVSHIHTHTHTYTDTPCIALYEVMLDWGGRERWGWWAGKPRLGSSFLSSRAGLLAALVFRLLMLPSSTVG